MQRYRSLTDSGIEGGNGSFQEAVFRIKFIVCITILACWNPYSLVGKCQFSSGEDEKTHRREGSANLSSRVEGERVTAPLLSNLH